MRCPITLAGCWRWAQAAEPDTVAVTSFEKQVRPLLAEHCHGCHSAKANKTRGGLAIDSR